MVLALVIVAIAFGVYLAYLGQISKSGKATGLVDGKLSPCPGNPNCVCSEYPRAADHAIEALDLHGLTPAAALRKLTDIIEAQNGSIETAREDYIAATFASALFGFVDDFEIRIDTVAGLIHLRSGSRVGTSDIGANRKRVELIRHSYLENQ